MATTEGQITQRTADLATKLPGDLSLVRSTSGSDTDTQTEPYDTDTLSTSCSDDSEESDDGSSSSSSSSRSSSILRDPTSKLNSTSDGLISTSTPVFFAGAVEIAAKTADTPPPPQLQMYDAKTLVKVRGRYYDLSKFDHPGGAMAIVQGVGSDITAVVASHHFTDAPYIAMRKYEVPTNQVQGEILNAGYSFKEDGFHNVLKKRIVEEIANGDAHLMRAASRPSNWYIAHVVGCLSLYALSWGWCCFASEFSWTIAVVAMLTRTSLVGIGHEALHGRLSGTLFYLFGMVLCHPSEDWHLLHVHQHHPHTRREGMDPDEDGLAPMVRLNKWTKWHPWHVAQILIQIVVSFFFSIALWVEHAVVGTLVSGDYTKYFLTQTASLLVFQLLPLLVATHGHGWHAVIIVIGLSNVLTLHSFHISHINEQNEVGKHEPDGMDWGEWQCRTSSNWDSGWEVTGMLEYQIEHHLFPSLPYEMQKKIRPIVRQTCKEFNVPYFEYSSYLKGIYAHLEYLISLSFNPEEPSDAGKTKNN